MTRRSRARWSSEVLDPDAVVQQLHNDGVHEHGRSLVLGGRRTRADAAPPTVRGGRRHTAVPVGRTPLPAATGRGGAGAGHRAAGVRRRRGRLAGRPSR